ncbi:MAG TPA: hypothetical protein VHG72_01925 [Polyangia bacterium]|nr:hypothetical protein [Polyangia bacterium]
MSTQRLRFVGPFARLAWPAVLLLAAFGRAPAAAAPKLVTDPLQFESEPDWHLTQGQVASLATTSVHTQGQAALAIAAPQNYVRIDSKAIDSTNPELAPLEVGSQVSLDFQIPVAQANPYWFGNVQMFISAPSRNVYGAYLGDAELTGRPTGVFTTLQFAIPAAVASALEGATYSDLTVGIALTVPGGTTGVYIIDNFRLTEPKLPSPSN